MKELIAAIVLVGIVAYFWFHSPTQPTPEASEAGTVPRATARTRTVTNPTGDSSATIAPTDGSLATRWRTGAKAQSNLTATAPDRWKTGPNAQTDLSGTPSDRWKARP